MIEEWKPIIGYEGFYEVSNLGRIKSIRFGQEKSMKPGKHYKGYSLFCLSIKGFQSMFNVSRLVGVHFIDNPLNLPLVCHKDETQDEKGFLYNGADNLFWGTYSDNMVDKYKKGRANNLLQLNHPNKGKFGKNNHLSKKINQYTKDGEFIQEWNSMADAQRELGIDQSSISNCCKGKQKTAGSFIWKYA